MTSDAVRPRYARPALVSIIVVAAVLFAWDIDQPRYHMFYGNAVRSMTESWRAFFFGSFDPNNSITIDKLPGFLWPQALSARAFGFHPWALRLPQVAEGVLCVLVLHRLVRRWAGEVPALLAAGIFTITPVTAGVFRSPAEDAAFTLLVLLAADACHRATRGGGRRWLVLSGVWVGLAFQTKMIEAFAVLPALAALCLLGVARPRLARLGAAAGVMVAVSASWTVIATAVPAHARPYIDGTTDNSPWSMVVGYNFLNRFGSLGISAGSTGSVTAVRAATGDHDDGGWGKMFGPDIAAQTGWLYPLAALALALGIAWRRGAPRTDPVRAGFVMWGLWLASFFVVFSAGSVGRHMYYMGVVAAPLAALSGAGIMLLWRAFRDGGSRAWALPVALVATVAWCALLAAQYRAFPWLAPVVVGLGAVSLALLAWRHAGHRPGRARRELMSMFRGQWAVLALPATVATMLLAPGVWAASGFTMNGLAGMGAIGPARPGAAPPWAERGGTGDLTPHQRDLLAYAESHRDGARYLFAAESWRTAAPYILRQGAPVLPMGGFTGQAPFPVFDRFRDLVSSGQVQYVLLDGRRTATGTSAITSWVRSACTPVLGPATEQLYRCRLGGP